MILLVCHGRGDAVPERVRDTHQRRATPQRRHTKVNIFTEVLFLKIVSCVISQSQQVRYFVIVTQSFGQTSLKQG